MAMVVFGTNKGNCLTAFVTLKDMTAFTYTAPPKGAPKQFRWPEMKDLENMNLREPLKLSEITTWLSSEDERSLTGIQFRFEGGIVSPKFGSGCAKEGAPVAYEVKGPIKALLLQINKCTIQQLQIKYEDDSTEKVCALLKDVGEVQEQNVPEGGKQMIVGFHGKYLSSRITQLDFVLMDTSAIE